MCLVQGAGVCAWSGGGSALGGGVSAPGGAWSRGVPGRGGSALGGCPSMH